MECPDDNALTQWLRRALPDARQHETGAHVQACAACTALVALLGESFVEEPAAQHIGRYVVLRALGSGGFGVVYLAWDPQLDRQIALKVSRPLGRDAEALAEGLLREAKAMAKLAHPNVTRVYDVAAVDGQVAIAMELIDGSDAREWLAQAPRSPGEVLSVFLAAAQGLAAAHAVGLVHRDFKPANVLVGKDGRVAVTDFGLARAERSGGARSGTPGYVAPEQRSGESVDARADQYSFAVALKEALGSAAPRALERSLAPSPEGRFPDMAALIDALSPRRRGVWLKVAVGLAVALTPIAAAYTWSVRRDALCSGAPARVREIWAGPRAGPADRAIDAWLSRWGSRYTEACEATRLRGEQPEDVLAARMSCLDRLHDQARAVIEAVGRAGPEEQGAALRLAASLDPPDRCMDAGPLLREERPAQLQQGTVRQLRFELEQARAERNLGHLDAAAELARRAVARAEPIAFAPLAAELNLFAGEGEMMLGDAAGARRSLSRAVHDAARGRSDRTAADAWIALLRLDGITANDDVGRPWREAATAAAERVRGDAVIEARLENALGLSVAAAGRLKEALELQLRALAALARAYGSDAPQLGPQRHKVAELLLDLGAYASAAKEAEKSRSEIARAFGADHPMVSLPEEVLAGCACAQRDFTECGLRAEAALSLRATPRTPADHPAFIGKHLLAAVAARGLGQPSDARFDEAERLARKAGDAWLGRVLAERGGLERTAQAVKLLSAALGPEHPDTRRARGAWAFALLESGRAEEAERAFGELATAGEAPWLLGQAKAQIAQGRASEAVLLLQRAARAAGDEDSRSAAEAASLIAQPSSGAPRPSP